MRPRFAAGWLVAPLEVAGVTETETGAFVTVGASLSVVVCATGEAGGVETMMGMEDTGEEMCETNEPETVLWGAETTAHSHTSEISVSVSTVG